MLLIRTNSHVSSVQTKPRSGLSVSDNPSSGSSLQQNVTMNNDQLSSQSSSPLEASLLNGNAVANPTKLPRVYFQRWIQLTYLSLLALLSDWVCFSLAAAPEAFEEYYEGYSSASLIDLFLFVNVASCFFVTDLVAKFGMKPSIRASAGLMCVGCWFRSGWNLWDTKLESIENVVLGTTLVAVAQPFFQCTPPLLSAQWFASSERATSTAVALNFNQVGIATAFLVGGAMATSTIGISNYFGLMSICSTVLFLGTMLQFQEEPEIAPSTSEWNKRTSSRREPPFRLSVVKFFKTPGFSRPLAAFICSIAITNIVGAFIDQIMEDAEITNKLHVALAGAGFEFAIVLGGIILGGYVDKTKDYKRITIFCLILSCICIIPLGCKSDFLGSSPSVVVLTMLALGFFAGPIQPINAELAVDVTYPGDETAVESIQQIGGNLFSALLVPLAERASRRNYKLLQSVPALASTVRGDIVLLIVVTIVTYLFFRGFQAPLRRSLADRRDDDMREDGVELSNVEEAHRLIVV